MIRRTTSIAAILAGIGCACCTLPAPVHRAYGATIERVGEREEVYEYVSPFKGYKPLHCLYLRVNDPTRSRGEPLLRVLVLDVYAPAAYGQAGDTVSFLYTGKLPEGGVVEFESLADYRVAARRP
jgi:hypothetical protein